jgi:hypothetical protein
MLEVELVVLEEISVHHELVHDLSLSVKAGKCKCTFCEIHPRCWALRGLQNSYYIRDGSLLGMQSGRIS